MRLGEDSTPAGGNACRATPLLRIRPWHLPSKWGKSR